MDAFTSNPVLGHITTFGGHPVCCSAGKAGFEFLIDNNLHKSVSKKEALFHSLLIHSAIKKINSCGLLMAIEFESYELNKKIIDQCILNGVFTDWFLFASNCLRIAPPLIISEEEIKESCAIILTSINEILNG
jgi:acetylornithine/succinyldiaminopimelate/putrescine aminotransferase